MYICYDLKNKLAFCCYTVGISRVNFDRQRKSATCIQCFWQRNAYKHGRQSVTSTIISVTSQQWLQTFYRSSDLLGTTRDREPWKTTLVLIYKLDVILVWKQGPFRLNDKFAWGIFVAKETICETLVFAKDGRERTGCCEGSTIYILFIVYIVMQECCHNPSTYASANIGLRF